MSNIYNKELVIVRGDLTQKPVVAKEFANFFEDKKDRYDGVLYIGYPIIGTSNGGYQIDCLMITKEHGLIAINLIEEKQGEEIDNFRDIQDENFEKLNSKLFLNRDLTNRRNLGFPINTITYAPRLDNSVIEEDYKLYNNLDVLFEFIETLNWENKYYESLVSAIQSITSIRNNKVRNYVKETNSRGSKLKKLEDSIANLDRQQSRAVIETVEGVQRIRGLAGSGKTIILALKVAYLHVKNPNWNIAVTFNTRALKEQFRKLINMFVIEHSNNEPDWSKIHIIHAWGTHNSEGIYYDLCLEHSIKYFDFTEAKSLSNVYGKEFDAICDKALTDIKEFKTKYDLIVIDEAQDFSKSFLKICYNILKSPKRLVYAYDELQSLNKNSMENPEIIFGSDKLGRPLVKLANSPNQPMQDIILYKCYRNPKEILTTAHALGFGVYRENGLIQMFDDSNLWTEVGYEIVDGVLSDGAKVVLSRNNESSPDFLSQHSDIDDIVSFKSFNNNYEQVEFVVNEIVKNINEDELSLDDIIIINTDPLTTKKVVGNFRVALYEKGINTNLAGVSSSPDIFFDDNTITFTGIFRAKGNEAAMIYVINAQDCYDGLELAKKRNILFTAMTRSKAWVRVCGYGEKMKKLENEFNQVKEHDFKLDFTYPTLSEREKMNIVNRDMTDDQKKAISTTAKSLNELTMNLESGKIFVEDVDPDLLSKLKSLLGNETTGDL